MAFLCRHLGTCLSFLEVDRLGACELRYAPTPRLIFSENPSALKASVMPKFTSQYPGYISLDDWLN